jgi:hypothetical protein
MQVILTQLVFCGHGLKTTGVSSTMNIILNGKARVGFDFGIDNDRQKRRVEAAEAVAWAMMTIKTKAAGEQREKGY